MAQLSRPYQIALAAIVLLGLVWAVALRGHSNPSEPAPSASQSSSTPSAPAKSGATNGTSNSSSSSVYHGSAPGVEGLTRDVAKAHEAVKTSEVNAQQLQRKSSEASQEAPASPATGRTRPTHASIVPKSHTAPKPQNAHKHSETTKPSKPSGGRSAQQAAVESELQHGKTVMLLFWDPESLLDREVRAQAASLAHHSKRDVTLHVALSNQVGLFGPITEVAHVYQTPTILIVNKHGVVSTLTGLTDVFSLEHALSEARKASA